jgi:tetratricopeptide (TPR) repeat protein
VVGVSEFRSHPELNLRFAAQDAEQFSSYLRTRRGGGLRDREELWEIVNGDATRDRVTVGLSEFLRQAGGENHTAMLYFATHGIYSCKSSRGKQKRDQCGGTEEEDIFLLAHDSDKEDLASTAIRLSDLYDVIMAEAGHFKSVFLILDVCHGGNLAAMPMEVALFPQDLEARFRQEAKGAVALLMASDRQPVGKRAFERSQEGKTGDIQGGVFTAYLVNGLNGAVPARSGGQVVLEDLMAYVQGQVAMQTGNAQNPEYVKTEAGMVLVQDTNLPGLAREALQESGETVRVSKVKPAGPLPAAIEPRAQKEQAGQRGILHYLRGEQRAQGKEEFHRCALAFEQALELAPDAAFTESRQLFCQGRNLLFEGDREKAAALLERAIRIDPGRGYAYNALGILYLEAGQYARAKDAFEDASRYARYWAYPAHNLGLTYEQSGDYAAAERAYRKAMELAPAASYSAYNLGLMLQRLNRSEEARQMLALAVANGETPGAEWPGLAEGYNALGVLAASLRQRTQAADWYKKALRKEPRLDTAEHNLALLEAEQGSGFEMAEARWRRLMGRSDRGIRIGARVALARELAVRGREEEAAELYREVLSEYPHHFQVRRALAVLLVRQGRMREAAAAMEEGAHPELEEMRRDIAGMLAGKKPKTAEMKAAAERRRAERKRE